MAEPKKYFRKWTGRTLDKIARGMLESNKHLRYDNKEDQQSFNVKQCLLNNDCRKPICMMKYEYLKELSRNASDHIMHFRIVPDEFTYFEHRYEPMEIEVEKEEYMRVIDEDARHAWHTNDEFKFLLKKGIDPVIIPLKKIKEDRMRQMAETQESDEASSEIEQELKEHVGA